MAGAATQLFATSATVYIQQATPAAQRGLALSAYNAGFIGFVPAGAFAVAAIASTAGTRWALVAPGLAILACGTILTVRLAARDVATKDAAQAGQEPEPGAHTAARSAEKGTSS